MANDMTAENDIKQRLLGVAIELATQLAIIRQMIEELDEQSDDPKLS